MKKLITLTIATLFLFAACSNNLVWDVTLDPISEELAAEIEKLTDEEREIWESMPDVVFVLLYNETRKKETNLSFYDKYGNIRKVAPVKYCGINNTRGINSRLNNNQSNEILNTIKLSVLIDCYVKLLNVDEKSGFNEINSHTALLGSFSFTEGAFYGIRNNNNHEMILLYKHPLSTSKFQGNRISSDKYQIRDDKNARDIFDIIGF